MTHITEGCKQIYIRAFQMYCPIWLRFGTIDVYIILLSSGHSCKYRRWEGGALLVSKNDKLIRSCVP
jgi:hypothetical protein